MGSANAGETPLYSFKHQISQAPQIQNPTRIRVFTQMIIIIIHWMADQQKV